jgi:hypothetical protein
MRPSASLLLAAALLLAAFIPGLHAAWGRGLLLALSPSCQSSLSACNGRRQACLAALGVCESEQQLATALKLDMAEALQTCLLRYSLACSALESCRAASKEGADKFQLTRADLTAQLADCMARLDAKSAQCEADLQALAVQCVAAKDGAAATARSDSEALCTAQEVELASSAQASLDAAVLSAAGCEEELAALTRNLTRQLDLATAATAAVQEQCTVDLAAANQARNALASSCEASLTQCQDSGSALLDSTAAADDAIVASISHDIQNLTGTVAAHNASIQALASQVQASGSSHAAAIQAGSTALSSCIQAALTAQQRLESDNQQLRSAFSSLQASDAGLKANSTRDDAAIVHLFEARAAALGSTSKCYADSAALESGMQSRIDAQANALAGVAARAASLEQRLANASSGVARASDKGAALVAEHEQLALELNATRGDLSTASTQIENNEQVVANELQPAIQAREQSLAQATASVAGLQLVLAEVDANITQRRAQVADCTGNVLPALQSQHAVKAKAQRDQLAALQQEQAGLQEDSRGLAADDLALLSVLHRLKGMLDATGDSVGQLHRQLNSSVDGLTGVKLGESSLKQLIDSSVGVSGVR